MLLKQASLVVFLAGLVGFVLSSILMLVFSFFDRVPAAWFQRVMHVMERGMLVSLLVLMFGIWMFGIHVSLEGFAEGYIELWRGNVVYREQSPLRYWVLCVLVVVLPSYGTGAFIHRLWQDRADAPSGNGSQ